MFVPQPSPQTPPRERESPLLPTFPNFTSPQPPCPPASSKAAALGCMLLRHRDNATSLLRSGDLNLSIIHTANTSSNPDNPQFVADTLDILLLVLAVSLRPPRTIPSTPQPSTLRAPACLYNSTRLGQPHKIRKIMETQMQGRLMAVLRSSRRQPSTATRYLFQRPPH